MDEPPPVRPAWLLAVAAVAVGQLGLALPLFGPDPWAAVADSRPLVGGRHPLHLYHGSLGATAFRERWAATSYDPQFQAGYPKTPVFDAGSRPAELFLLFAGQPRDAIVVPDAMRGRAFQPDGGSPAHVPGYP